MAYQPEQRALIEQILDLYGYRPEALPNLFTLRRQITDVPLVPERVPKAVQNTIAQLADWRTMFPETVDSIIGLNQRNIASASTRGLDEGTVRWAGRPLTLTTADVPGSLEVPIVDVEPSPPQFASERRFTGQLPDPRLFEPPVNPGQFSEREWAGLHPILKRRLMVAGNNPVAFTGGPPDWGGALTSQALVSRLKREAPELYAQLMQTSPLWGLRRELGQRPITGGLANATHNDVTRRIANIYSQLPYRHSSQPVNPRLLTEHANKFINEYDRTTPMAGQYLRERLKAAEFRPGKSSFDNLMDELAVMQGETEDAIGRTRLEQDLSRSAKTATNPTNAKIQKLLTENLGFGKGKVMAPFVEDTLDPMRHLRPARLARAVPWMLADIGVNKAIDELVPEKGPWDDLLRGAYMGGTTGAMFGVPGAVAGAGIGALLSQVF